MKFFKRQTSKTGLLSPAFEANRYSPLHYIPVSFSQLVDQRHTQYRVELSDPWVQFLITSISRKSVRKIKRAILDNYFKNRLFLSLKYWNNFKITPTKC